MAIPPDTNEINKYGIYKEIKDDAYIAAGDMGEEDTDTVDMSAYLQTITLNSNSPNYATKFGNHAGFSSGVYDGESQLDLSIFGSYDDDAAPAFTNTKAVSKTTSVGTANAITFTDTDDTLNITGSSAWSISFWVKAGWTVNLNTNIHFLIGQKSGAAKQIEDMVKIIYAENTNRIEVRYGNVAGSSQWYNQGGWLFHANYGVYQAGYQAAGLGTTFWSAANRGYTGDDDGGTETDYTMITVTNDGTNTAASLRLYWNANGMGTAPIQTNSNSGSRSGNPMSTTNDRLWSLGSNGEHSNATTVQQKCGNGSATVYNDLTIWSKKLSDSEVTSLYNSGTAINPETHSASSNLIGYWNFEVNGNISIDGNDNFAISGGSSIVNK